MIITASNLTKQIKIRITRGGITLVIFPIQANSADERMYQIQMLKDGSYTLLGTTEPLSLTFKEFNNYIESIFKRLGV